MSITIYGRALIDRPGGDEPNCGKARHGIIVSSHRGCQHRPPNYPDSHLVKIGSGRSKEVSYLSGGIIKGEFYLTRQVLPKAATLSPLYTPGFDGLIAQQDNMLCCLFSLFQLNN